MNQTAFGLGQRTTNKKSFKKTKIDFKYYISYLLDDPTTDLIDLSSPGTHRTDVTQSEIGEISHNNIV